MISEREVSIKKNQGNFRIGVYEITRLNPQVLGFISGTTEFLVELSLGRSIPRLIAKPVVAGHTGNYILATRAVVGEKSRLRSLTHQLYIHPNDWPRTSVVERV